MTVPSRNFIIITGIHGMTEAVRLYAEKKDWYVVFVGDRKSEPIPSSDHLTYLSLDDQQALGFSYTKLCPQNHYARKNIGYLYAMRAGATALFDTDDDNLPLASWAQPEWTSDQQCHASSGVANVYQYFIHDNVWPRGFPLDHIHDQPPALKRVQSAVGIWQSLANHDPDVDAIHRLVFPDPLSFKEHSAFALARGTYCPFNSQATFWHPDAFPLLYLPAHVSFRFTDIFRGYVAQRLLWEQGRALGFTAPMVVQERNEHDLMKDFSQEIECYTGVTPLMRTLEDLSFKGDAETSLLQVYETLAEKGIVPHDERALCRAWIDDLQSIAMGKA